MNLISINLYIKKTAKKLKIARHNKLIFAQHNILVEVHHIKLITEH